jgi:biotin synthase
MTRTLRAPPSRAGLQSWARCGTIGRKSHVLPKYLGVCRALLAPLMSADPSPSSAAQPGGGGRGVQRAAARPRAPRRRRPPHAQRPRHGAPAAALRPPCCTAHDCDAAHSAAAAAATGRRGDRPPRRQAPSPPAPAPAPPRPPPAQVQRCTLLSIKTGGCPENCNYCSQSSHWSKETGTKAEKLMDLEDVYEVRAPCPLPLGGAPYFCSSAAALWPAPPQPSHPTPLRRPAGRAARQGLGVHPLLHGRRLARPLPGGQGPVAAGARDGRPHPVAGHGGVHHPGHAHARAGGGAARGGADRLQPQPGHLARVLRKGDHHAQVRGERRGGERAEDTAMGLWVDSAARVCV